MLRPTPPNGRSTRSESPRGSRDSDLFSYICTLSSRKACAMSEIRNVGLGEIALEVGEQTPSEQVVCRFPGRRVFITGGANGIGRVLVESFCHAGCRVAFCDCDRVAGDCTALESGARFFPLDVCDAEVLEACLQGLFAEWGDLDVVINNVGISFFRRLSRLPFPTSTGFWPPTCVRFSSRRGLWPATVGASRPPIPTGGSSTSLRHAT